MATRAAGVVAAFLLDDLPPPLSKVDEDEASSLRTGVVPGIDEDVERVEGWTEPTAGVAVALQESMPDSEASVSIGSAADDVDGDAVAAAAEAAANFSAALSKKWKSVFCGGFAAAAVDAPPSASPSTPVAVDSFVVVSFGRRFKVTNSH